jgi:type IV pilus assembly protein PilM
VEALGYLNALGAIALPTSHVITKKIIVAAGQREEELELQVESEANQYIPFALEEVNLDFQIAGPAPSSPDEIEVLIAASRKEKVEDRVAVVESAGLKPVVMDVESYAVLVAFELISKQLPEGGKGQISRAGGCRCQRDEPHGACVMGSSCMVASRPLAVIS